MSVFRAILAAMAVLAMLSAPAGYMPARAADGSAILMICPKVQAPAPPRAAPAHAMTMHGAAEPHGVASAHDDHDDHQMAADSPCDYAVGAVADVPTGDLTIAVADRIVIDQPLLPHALTGIFPRGLPPATGPPSL